MSGITLGRDLSKAIAEALGLDPQKVRRVTIDADLNEFSIATVEMFIDEDAVERIVETTRKVNGAAWIQQS